MKIFKNKEKEILKKHKWLCNSKICLKTLKELEKTLDKNWNIPFLEIAHWEKQLERCNRCYLEEWNHSYLNTITRGNISTEVNFVKSNK